MVTRAISERGKGRRARTAGVVVLAGVLALLAGALPGVASAGSCPNEEIRAEQGSERLPDCRAFELVTPEVKGDDSAIGGVNGSPLGFPDGNHVFYRSLLPLPGSGSGELESVLSTRTASGWVNTPLAPPAGPGEPVGLFAHTHAVAATPVTRPSPVTSRLLLSTRGSTTDPLDEDGACDAYRMDLSSGVWSLAALPDTGPTDGESQCSRHSAGTFIAGVSENGSHVFFQTFDQLPVAPGTPSEPHPAGHAVRPYRWSHVCGWSAAKRHDFANVQRRAWQRPCGRDFIAGRISLKARSLLMARTSCSRSARRRGSCLEPGVYLRENDATTVQLAGMFYAGRSSDGSKVITVGNDAVGDL